MRENEMVHTAVATDWALRSRLEITRQGDDEAHAKRIVQAVNAFGPMLEALKKSRAALTQASAAEETGCGCSCGLTAACISADAAIAKAEPVAVGRPPTWTNTCGI